VTGGFGPLRLPGGGLSAVRAFWPWGGGGWPFASGLAPGRRGRRGIAALPALLLALAVAGLQPAQGETVAERAEAAAAALREAGAALVAAAGARDRVAALSMTIRAYEDGLGALRESLRQAVIREAVLRRGFDARCAQVAQLLAVLSAVERTRGPLLLLHPAGALGTVRSGMLLAEVTPALAAEAEMLRAQLQELARIRALREAVADDLEQGLRAMLEARVALSRAIADREALPAPVAADADALARLAAGAETLAAFADGLARLPAAGTGAVPGPEQFEQARGQLPLPVRGTLLRRAGEADAAGVRRPGVVIATRPRALVSAPWPSTIRYLGPLLDYGNVMVLEPDDDYLLILAGLDVVYGRPGMVVAAGAPLGLMGGAEPRAMEFLSAASGGGGDERSETLYLELRQRSGPVDPSDWFAQIGD